ncbi:MAG: hypothetical protein ACPG1Z_03420 [Planctomycetota bacterium]
MKYVMIAIGILGAVSFGTFIQQKGQIEQARQEIQKSNNTLQVLKERIETLENQAEEKSEAQVFAYTGPESASEENIPEELVTALANRLVQDRASMQAIAREVPRNRDSGTGGAFAGISAKEFDSQVRDTIEAIEEEERAERMQRMQERALERSADRANRIAEQLQLDDRTAQQFSSLMVDHSSERMQIMMEAREMDLGRSETRNLLNTVREEQNEEISGILTANQYEQYLEIPQDDWGRGRGGWGGPPSNNNGNNNNSGNSNNGNTGGGGAPGRNSGP